MNLTVFGLLVAYCVDSGAVISGFGFYDHSDVMTKMVWSQGCHIKRRLLCIYIHAFQQW